MDLFFLNNHFHEIDKKYQFLKNKNYLNKKFYSFLKKKYAYCPGLGVLKKK